MKVTFRRPSDNNFVALLPVNPGWDIIVTLFEVHLPGSARILRATPLEARLRYDLIARGT